METTNSMSDANRAVEFYVPGTFQFSRAPGRIERFLAGLVHDPAVATTVVASAPERPIPEPSGIGR